MILKEMSPQFVKLFSDVGRPSIAPAQFGMRLRFTRHSRRRLEVSWQWCAPLLLLVWTWLLFCVKLRHERPEIDLTARQVARGR